MIDPGSSFDREMVALERIKGVHLGHGEPDELVIVMKAPEGKLRKLEVAGAIAAWVISWALLALVILGFWKVVDLVLR